MKPAFEDLRVGYVPSTPAARGPVDRRRFVHYAKKRGIPFELVRPGREYDVVVLSGLADLTHYSRLPEGRPRLVFDLPNSYLDIAASDLRGILRGPAKFALRQHRHLEWSYHASLGRMCRRADAVVCSTPEQRERIVEFNPNVHPILDFHVEETIARKSSYEIGSTVNLVWEGQAGNLFTLARLAPALRRMSRRRSLVLHLVTDLRYKPANGPVPFLSTDRLVEKHLSRIDCALYQWNQSTFAPISASCDLGVIPIALETPIHRAKPENKLLLFWRIGLPVVTSASPAYVRSMGAAGVDMIVGDDEAWEERIERALSNEARRREAAERGRMFAEAEHGVDRNLARWDAVMEFVLG